MSLGYREIEGRSARYYALLAGLVALDALALVAAYAMEERGHVITGMSNQIVWGMPHVFAVFLIVAASGALNVASIASVFGRALYKPLAPLSGLVALALLAGGLAVLVLDLGRPERLIVAMTRYNFRSIFAWNIFLYTGFAAVIVAYLWTMLERGTQRYTRPVGTLAFAWRLLLTTGTGSIFGFLVAREPYDSALLAPLFIALSLSYGLAAFLLVLLAACRGAERPLGATLLARLARLQAIFIVAGLYFVAVSHLTNLYFAQRREVERFLLVDGGVYTALFWIGQIGIGSLLPLAIALHPRLSRSVRWLATAAMLVVAGGLAQMYVTIIGGQAYPLALFPGMEVASSFRDGVVHGYTPSLPEIALGVGGVALAGVIVTLAVKLLRVLPERLDDGLLAALEAPPAATASKGASA
ncbi:MAG TPA: NrfD/PsrC family molybdoenzyme membrane anchor subunit [Casimicrobiaceae bacterium]